MPPGRRARSTWRWQGGWPKVELAAPSTDRGRVCPRCRARDPVDEQKKDAGPFGPASFSKPIVYLSHFGSPSPAAGLTEFGVATAIAQVMPGICGCVSVADQYDVLGTTVGRPTADVCEKPVSSGSWP